MTDYINTSDVKSYGGIPSTDTVDDTEVSIMITRAQAYIEEYTGRVFQSDSDAETARYFTAVDDVDGDRLWLDQDLNTVKSLVAGTDTIASTNYVTEPRSEGPYFALTMKSQSPQVWTNTDSDGEHESAIVVTAQWAYSSDVPEEIKHAMVRLVGWFYAQSRTSLATTIDLNRVEILPSGGFLMPAQFPADVLGILDLFKKKLVAS